MPRQSRWPRMSPCHGDDLGSNPNRGAYALVVQWPIIQGFRPRDWGSNPHESTNGVQLNLVERLAVESYRVIGTTAETIRFPVQIWVLRPLKRRQRSGSATVCKTVDKGSNPFLLPIRTNGSVGYCAGLLILRGNTLVGSNPTSCAIRISSKARSNALALRARVFGHAGSNPALSANSERYSQAGKGDGFKIHSIVGSWVQVPLPLPYGRLAKQPKAVRLGRTTQETSQVRILHRPPTHRTYSVARIAQQPSKLYERGFESLYVHQGELGQLGQARWPGTNKRRFESYTSHQQRGMPVGQTTGLISPWTEVQVLPSLPIYSHSVVDKHIGLWNR